MDYTMIEVKKIGVPEYHFVDNLGNIIYKMKRKAISFEDKYIIFDCTDVKIGELNAKPFKHGIFEFIYNNECIDYVLKTFENFTYCLEKKKLDF